jgi:hypothetical protein
MRSFLPGPASSRPRLHPWTGARVRRWGPGRFPLGVHASPRVDKKRRGFPADRAQTTPCGQGWHLRADELLGGSTVTGHVVEETRLLFEDQQGALRPFLNVARTADGVVISSPVGVPGILRSWDVPLRADVPNVAGLHLTIHGSGLVHLREDGTRRDLDDAFHVPPLRDFAAASYFLHLIPAPIEAYPVAAASRANDTRVHVGDVQGRGFVVLVAVAIADGPDEPVRQSLPGLDPAGPPRAVRITRAKIGRLEVQAAVAWLMEGELRPAAREIWNLVRLPEGGDHLPRPLGGTSQPSAWDHLVGPDSTRQ